MSLSIFESLHPDSLSRIALDSLPPETRWYGLRLVNARSRQCITAVRPLPTAGPPSKTALPTIAAWSAELANATSGKHQV
jgi:hypothetical protein